MIFDDLETWRVIYSQFVGIDFKYGMTFTLNNAPRLRIALKLEL